MATSEPKSNKMLATICPGTWIPPVNLQNIPTPELWIGPQVAGGGGGPLPGLQESETGAYILDSEDGQRIIPSQE